MKKFSIRNGKGKYVELSAPLKVYYDITTKCNLNCIFCFKGKCDSDVSWSQAKKIIKQVADASIPDIIFIGGEPMCCPFLFDALQYAKELGINPGIVTNGTLFTDSNADLLKNLVNNSISVSIHAPNDTVHDEISQGVNVYTSIIDGLNILNEHGIIPELSFTPVKPNIDLLYETIDGIFQKGIQISDVLVNRLIPSGNALNCWHDKMIGLDDQNRLFEQMERLSNKYPNMIITTGDAIPFCMVEEKYRKFITRCDYAITLGWINDQNLFGKCMVRGSSGADSLEKNDIRKLWKQSKSFLEHRCMENLPIDCKECDWLIQCGGGCACSSMGKNNQDAYFERKLKYSMPSFNYEVAYNDTVIISSNDLDNIPLNAEFKLKRKFYIRRECSHNKEKEEIYLFLPESSGAVIQDVITSDGGEILWINKLEKQIILYMQNPFTVNEIAKCISYEFGISINEALIQVKNTIATLQILNMVKKI